MRKKKGGTHRQSKAQLAVDLQTQNHSICDQIKSLRDTAASVLESEAPTKRIRKELLDTAESLLVLQSSVQAKIPELVPKDCTKYSLKRLHAANNHNVKMQFDVRPPRENMRVRIFTIAGKEFPLPANTTQFTALEACSILQQVEKFKLTSTTKAIRAMIDYSTLTSSGKSLIPCGLSTLQNLYKNLKLMLIFNGQRWADLLS